MQKFTLPLQKFICVLLLICLVKIGKSQAPPAQTLKLTDFAVWGGGASPNPYNSTQGVFITNTVNIEGNIGSNHLVAYRLFCPEICQGNRLSSDVDYGGIVASRSGKQFDAALSG